MRFESDGLVITSGARDGAFPGGRVPADQPIRIVVAVSPISAGTKVFAEYRVNGGKAQIEAGTWLRNDLETAMQFFRIDLPRFRPRDRIEYVIACSSAGRSVRSHSDVAPGNRAFLLEVVATDALAEKTDTSGARPGKEVPAQGGKGGSPSEPSGAAPTIGQPKNSGAQSASGGGADTTAAAGVGSGADAAIAKGGELGADNSSGSASFQGSTATGGVAGSGSSCGCDPCKSLFSPNAYLFDLLRFVSTSFDRSVSHIEDRLRQYVTSIPMDCASMEQPYPQIWLANEVLVAFIAERRGLDWRNLSSAQVDAIYGEFLDLPENNLASLIDWVFESRNRDLRVVTGSERDAVAAEYGSYLSGEGLSVSSVDQAFVKIIREFGTTREAVNDAMSAGPADRAAHADSLGLATADLALLATAAGDVKYSSLAQALDLLSTARTEILFRSLRGNVYREKRSQRLEELGAAMDSGVSGAPATIGAAEVMAEEYAEAEALAAEPVLRITAATDATAQVMQVRERIDNAFLPRARTNLAFIAHNEARLHETGLPEIASIKELGDFLNVDLSVDVCQTTTRVAFAIESLQSLVSAFLVGSEDVLSGSVDPQLWPYMKSFGIWHAVQTVFAYPEGFVLPSIRNWGDSWGGTGWSPFFDEMIDQLDAQPVLNLRAAQSALDFFAARLKDVAGVQVSHMVDTNNRLHLFCCSSKANRPGVATQLYYSTLDADEAWSGWSAIDLAGQTLRASQIDQRCVQDVVVADGRVNVFALCSEKRGALRISQDEFGAFKAPEPLGVENVSQLRAVIIRPREGVTGVPDPTILVFCSKPHAPNEYAVLAVTDSVAELDDAMLRLPPDSTLLSACSFSGLSGRSSARVVGHHMSSRRGAPVLFGVLTKTSAGTYVRTVYGNANADSDLWSRFNSQEGSRVLELASDPEWRSCLSLSSADVGTHCGKLLARWILSTEWVQIEQGARFYFLSADGALHEISGDLATSRVFGSLSPGSPGAAVETYQFSERGLYLHRAETLRRQPSTGPEVAVGQITVPRLEGIPLEIVVMNRTEPTEFGGSMVPVSTRYGRQSLKAIEAFLLSRFQYPGFARQYLEEFFLHAPLYLAARLNEEERFREAEEVLAAVFQPFVSAQEDAADIAELSDRLAGISGVSVPPAHPAVSRRFMYLGFLSEDLTGGPHLEYRVAPQYLADPLNPHRLARTRPLTYARYAVQMYLENALDWADLEFARDTAESVPRARELYENAETVLDLQDLPRELCAQGFGSLQMSATSTWGASGAAATQVTREFCIPPSPASEVFRFRVDSNLEKIRTCRNISGVKRALQTYAAAVDASALVGAAAGGAEIDDFVPSEPPPLYRYAVLLERTRYLIQIASHLEGYLLSVFEKLDEEEYSLLRARSDLRLSTENVALQSLQVRRAHQSVALARLQKARAELGFDYYDGLIEEGITGLEKAAIVAMVASGAASAVAAATAYVAGVAAVSSNIAALASTTASILQTFASFERREAEWNHQLDLAGNDVEIADQGIAISETEVDITEKERSIAVLSSQISADTLEFLSSRQFTGAELYRWMSKELRKLYRKHLNMAHAMARATQQALSFEMQEPMSFIGYQYGDTKHEGLLGAEKLTLDLEKLEQHRIAHAERRRNITEVLSLCALMPGEFQRFKRTGLLEFATPSAYFDRRAPGEYQRLIKSVEVSVAALVPPGRGIRATLTNNGVSRVVTGPPFLNATVVQRPPEAVSLSSAVNSSGLFELRLDDPMLLPFEGSGVDTNWVLELLPGANDFDFDTIMEVQMTVRYTARDDWGYRQRVIGELQKGYTNLVAASVRNLFPDSWYDFHNPRFADAYGFDGTLPYPPFTVSWEIPQDRFPPSERRRKIKRVIVACDLESPAMRVPIYVVFQPVSGAELRADNKELVDGRTSLLEFSGKEPYGRWLVVINTTANETMYPELFAGSTVVDGERRILTDHFGDFLLIVEYSAELRF